MLTPERETWLRRAAHHKRPPGSPDDRRPDIRRHPVLFKKAKNGGKAAAVLQPQPSPFRPDSVFPRG